VDVLHHDLETVEATSLGNLDFTTEALDKVLVDNSVGCSEERKDVGNEVSLVVIESIVPVVKVLWEVNLFGGPERSLSLLVHLPDLYPRMLALVESLYAYRVVVDATNLMVLDWEKDESMRILL
jgi:hypothetical protein